MINISHFKRHIIQLALQGKLTCQNPETESVEDLVNYLNKKNKKYANFSTDLTSFNIPTNWKWCMTYEAVSLDNGEPLSGPQLPYLDVKYLRTKNNPSFVNKGDVVFPGDKVILVDGENSGEVFAVSEKGYRGSTFKVLRISEAFISEYVLYFIMLYKEKFKENKTGSAIPHLNKTIFFELPIPLPPINEQKRIVERIKLIFEQLDIVDSKQDRLLTIKQRLEKRVYELAIKGKLVEQIGYEGNASETIASIQNSIIKDSKQSKQKQGNPSEEPPFDIPSSWKWCKLSEIGSTNIGLTYHPEDITEKGVLVIRSCNIRNGKMDYKEQVRVNCPISDKEYLKKNDIVICSRNGSKALVGKNAIFDGESNTISFGAFMAAFRTPIYQYVRIYFNTDAFKRYFSNDDSKQINQVTQAILKESLIPIPPIKEQNRIVKKVDELLKAIDRII